MPCNDPPYPYEGKHKESADEAVRILCKTAHFMVTLNLPPDKELLVWYRGHLEVDLERVRFHNYHPDEAVAIVQKIAKVDNLLASL